MGLFYDHIFGYWFIITCTIIVDLYLYNSGKWPDYKLNIFDPPVSLVQTVFLVLFNQFIISYPVITLFEKDFPVWTDFSFMQIFIALISVEILFYHLHYFFHSTLLYPLHKVHHSWRNTMAISTLYAHPLEHVLCNVLPVLLSAKLAGFSLLQARIWHMFALLYTTLGSHGGYILSNGHIYHHLYQNCNYGVIGLCDYIYGTNR